MLFDSTVRRDLARTFGATLVVVSTIMLTMMLVRTIGQAAKGIIAPGDVVLLLGYVGLGQLPTILALSMFVAIVAALGRMYRDSEMAVWFASGVGLARFVRPVLRTAWPVLAVVALLLLFAWPWGNRSSLEMRDRYAQRSDLSRVAPGQFQVSGDGKRVFFVERDTGGPGDARKVFIVTQQAHGESVTSARRGHLETVGGESFLILERGQRNELDRDSGTKTLARFDSYRARVGETAGQASESPPPRTRRTVELLREPTAANLGELAWRLGLVFAAANMLVLGVGLAAANPRRPSNWNLLFALLSFIVYFNLVNLTQAWVGSGRGGFGATLVALHGGVLALALALLWWRERSAVLAWRRYQPA
jgi:lipopolysaccharide export system permease protein